MWDLTGQKVAGNYLGESKYFVKGTVLDSRVMYGGSVLHRVQLDEPLYLPWNKEPRTVVSVEEENLV